MVGFIRDAGKSVFAIGFLSLILVASAAAQDELKVGDLIEFDFLGETRQATITKFTGTGWPYVEFEHRGRTMQRFFPTSRVRLVKSAEVNAGVDGADPMQSVSREWVDASGKYKVQGKLISNANGFIEIEKSDGRVVKLSIDKLSEKDQTYLKESVEEKGSDNPFAGGTNRSGGSSHSKSAALPASKTAISPAATANEKVPQARSWNYQPTPAPVATASLQTISLPKSLSKHAAHNRSTGEHISLDKNLFATVIGNPFSSESEIVIVDLAKGKATATKRIAVKQAGMLAVSPNGAYAATLRSGLGRSGGAIDFWRLDGIFEHVAAWKTGGSRDQFSPTQGRFIDPTKLLTVGKRLVLWDVKSATAIYSIEVTPGVRAAFSPSGKEIAVGTGTMIQLIDIESGNSLGQFLPPPDAMRLAFSQSGRFLAGIAPMSASIWIWDLKTNKLVRELSGPQKPTRMQWVGDEYLLINGRLIDVKLRVRIWRYAMPGGRIIDAQDGRQWFVGKNKMVPVSLPHKDFDDETAELDPDALLVFKPGTKVAFDFDTPFPPTEKNKIYDTLTSMLQKNQVTIDQTGSLRLVGRVTKQKQQSSTLSDFFSASFSRDGETVTYSPHLASLTLEKDGQVLWSKKTRFAPSGIISLKQGETGQQAVNRVCQPKSSFFTSVVLPKYLATLPGGKPLGTSKIDESGVN